MAKPSLFKNTKLKRLMKLTGLSRAQAIGHLECLWHAQYERSTAVIGDAEDVELAAEWEGDPGKLTVALAKVTFIEQRAIGVYEVHDFFDHAPDYVKKRFERQQNRLNKELQPKTADERTPDGRKRQTAADFGAYPHPSPPHPSPSHPNTAADAAVRLDAEMFASGECPPINPASSTSAGATAVRPPQPKQPVSASDRPRPSGAHYELIKAFCDGWLARYGAPYAFNAGKDGKHIKWILDVTFHDLAQATQIVQAYLRDEDAWLLERAHPLGLLVSGFNKYRAGALSPATARGSKHDQPNIRRTQLRAGEYEQPARTIPNRADAKVA